MQKPLIILTLFLLTSLSHAREIVDKQFSFRITIPDEFQDFPAGKNRPTVLYSFLRPSAIGEENINLIIERMNGTIGREPLQQGAADALMTKLPPGSHVGIYKTKWNGYSVEGLDMTMPRAGMVIVTHEVQIPLRGEAIQILVGGPQATDPELTKILQQVLRTLQGESNWDPQVGRKLNTGERVASGVTAVFWLCVTIAIAVVIAKGITSIFRRKRKETPGT